MTYQSKSVIAWAFVMIAFSVIPFTTTIIAEPAGFHLVLLMVIIGLIAGVIGKMFSD